MVTGKKALILRQTAGKVSATMNTKSTQAKVGELAQYRLYTCIKAEQQIRVSESNTQIFLT